jgi:hypothetical protein
LLPPLRCRKHCSDIFLPPFSHSFYTSTMVSIKKHLTPIYPLHLRQSFVSSRKLDK